MMFGGTKKRALVCVMALALVLGCLPMPAMAGAIGGGAGTGTQGGSGFGNGVDYDPSKDNTLSGGQEKPEESVAPSVSPSVSPSVQPETKPTDKPTEKPTEKPAQAASVTMWVATGNDAGLHLRTAPSTNGSVIHTYPNGTAVTVYATIGGWAYVSVAGKTGYMMLKYLTDKAPIGGAQTGAPGTTENTPPAATESTAMWIATGNPERLHLRPQPTTKSESLGLYPNGTQVTVTARTKDWVYVTVSTNGAKGWMMEKFLTAQKPGGAATETLPPITENTAMWIATGNTGKLHLRAKASTDSASLGKYPNGTPVTVHSRTNTWAYVTVNGQTGYMMLKFLTATQPTVTVPPVTPAPAGAYSMWIQTGNPERLHLRAKPSTSSTSLGLYSNGTEVTVTATTGAWAYVTVNGKTGYMMLKFLTNLKPGTTATPIPSAEPSTKPSTEPSADPSTKPSTDPSVSPEVTKEPTPSPIPTATPAPNQATVTQKSGSYVNMRSSKTDTNDSNVIAQIPSGTVVTVLEWGKPFSRIEYNGQQGYMNSSYLK